ncbi:hypothetical protein Leryth_020485 [Lithospermum erythrorhizon]|nr:hypothetical protein Leryth_020485 [Lithospermum erythrorhizon]
MQQLASGLKILRENNMIHRDLKPQNLLLSTNDDNSTLKIADFGFARSLQPRGLAETLCGSPLYMAPEIMQLQKYNAKADLWSVGAILFQLVTGRTPFTGNNQMQLLQNILKSTDLQFPPDMKDLSSDCMDLCRKLLRCNPVERLTFEEFFSHPFLYYKQPDDMLRNRRSQRVIDGFPISDRNPVFNTEQSFQEDLSFGLDDEPNGHDVSRSSTCRSPIRTTYGFSLDGRADKKGNFNTTNKADTVLKFSNNPQIPEAACSGSHQLSERNLKETLKSKDPVQLYCNLKVMDSLELIAKDYVMVSGPPMHSSSAYASKVNYFSSNSGNSPLLLGNGPSISSAPVPVFGMVSSQAGPVTNLDFHRVDPDTRQGSLNILNSLEQPSTDCVTRTESLKQCAFAITELVKVKMEEKKHLEALSIQLVVLAVWKQALDVCHAHAVSATEGSSAQDNPGVKESNEILYSRKPMKICFEIERAFLLEVEHAEGLAQVIEPGTSELPDAMETIYQASLDMGKHGAVKEYMGDIGSAEVSYTKAVRLLKFVLVEAPFLILNPPFSLTNADRYRLQNYIDLLTYRQSISRSQRIALLKSGDQQCTP